MRLINRSKVSTKRLRKVLSFILPYTRYYGLGRVEVDNYGGRVISCTTSGMAHKLDGNPNTYDPNRPSLVQIWIGNVPSYPILDQYKNYGPKVELSSLDEELVLVIAHELGHLDDFWAWDQTEISDRQSEVRAESFAVKVLNEYKLRNTRHVQKKEEHGCGGTRASSPGIRTKDPGVARTKTTLPTRG